MRDPHGHLTVFAPLRAEEFAVRKALPAATVLRTGMGVARAAEAAASNASSAQAVCEAVVAPRPIHAGSR